MKNITQIQLILWTKRSLGLIAFFVWISILYTLSKSSTPFMEQAPYCMAGTMLTFGILTGVYKALDYWNTQH